VTPSSVTNIYASRCQFCLYMSFIYEMLYFTASVSYNDDLTHGKHCWPLDFATSDCHSHGTGDSLDAESYRFSNKRHTLLFEVLRKTNSNFGAMPQCHRCAQCRFLFFGEDQCVL
jgi:hypothetical protein